MLGQGIGEVGIPLRDMHQTISYLLMLEIGELFMLF